MILIQSILHCPASQKVVILSYFNKKHNTLGLREAANFTGSAKGDFTPRLSREDVT